jgi:hypothetical protein
MCDLRNITAIKLSDGTIERYDDGVPAVYFDEEFAISRDGLFIGNVKTPGLYRRSAAPACGSNFGYFTGTSWLSENEGWQVKELIIEETCSNAAFQIIMRHGIDYKKATWSKPQLPEKFEIKVTFNDE